MKPYNGKCNVMYTMILKKTKNKMTLFSCIIRNWFGWKTHIDI